MSLEISPLASSTDSNKENEEAALPSESNPVSAHDKERRQNPLLKPSQAESPRTALNRTRVVTNPQTGTSLILAQKNRPLHTMVPLT